MKKFLAARKFSFNYFFIIFFSIQTTFLVWSSFRPVGGQHEFRQAQTLWPVKNWQLEGFSLLQPAVPVKGIAQQYWLLEFPLFQWIIYFIGAVVEIEIDYIARLVSLLLALSIVFFIAREIEKIHPNNLSLVLVLFTLNPYFYHWATTGLIDWLALFLGVIAGKLVISVFETNKLILLVPTGVLLALGFLVKISHAFFGFLFIILLFYLLQSKNLTLQNDLKKAIPALSTLFLSLLPFLLWTNFTTDLYQKNDSRFIWTTSSANYAWYFGSSEQYKQFASYVSLVFERYFTTVINLSFLIVLTIFVLYFIKKPLTLLAIIMLGFFYVFVLINLNVIHDYYQIPLLLISGLILSLAAVLLRNKLEKEPARFFSIIFTVLLLTSFSNFSSEAGKALYKDLYLKPKANISSCPSTIAISEPILTLQVENPALLYHCNLKSFMVVEGRTSDEMNFKKERLLYNYVLIQDFREIERVSEFLQKLGGSLSSEVGIGWYQIEWR